MSNKDLAEDIANEYGIPSKTYKRAIETIEIKESKPLSLFSRRLYNHLLAIAYKDLNNPRVKKFTVPLATFRLGNTSNQVVKKSVRELMNTTIEYNYYNRKNENVWTAAHLLGTVSMTAGVLEFSFPDEVRELMHEPAQYAQISLSVIYAFRSKYSLVLYELISIRYKLKHIKKEEFELDNFRTLMTVPDGKLSNFKDLRKNCFEPAIREVNHFSPFNVKIDPEKYKKAGRKVTHITIEWEKKDPSQMDNSIDAIDAEMPLFAQRASHYQLSIDTQENRKALDHYLRFGKGRRQSFLAQAKEKEKAFSGYIQEHKNNPEKWIHYVANEIKESMGDEW